MRQFGISADHHYRKYLQDELHNDVSAAPADIQYDYLKKSGDEIIRYSALLSSQNLNESSALLLNRLLAVARHGLYAAKALKDIEHNIHSLRNSPSEYDYGLYQHLREEMLDFMNAWLLSWNSAEDAGTTTKLEALLKEAENAHQQDVDSVYRHADKSSADTSTLLNVSREMYNAQKFLISAQLELLNKEPA